VNIAMVEPQNPPCGPVRCELAPMLLRRPAEFPFTAVRPMVEEGEIYGVIVLPHGSGCT
jgi:hypothetical protein